MLITLGILGSFLSKNELIEITGGSGIWIYGIWVFVLLMFQFFRYFNSNTKG